MAQITVAATDTQGKAHILDKPTTFNPANDSFLFGLERGRKEAATEAIALLMPNPPYMDTFGAMYARKLAKHFGIEI